MMMGSGLMSVMWVLMAAGMMIGLLVLVLATVTIETRTGALTKRKRGTYDPDADVYTFFEEKLKRETNYVLADDGEIVDVADDWQTNRMADNS